MLGTRLLRTHPAHARTAKKRCLADSDSAVENVDVPTTQTSVAAHPHSSVLERPMTRTPRMVFTLPEREQLGGGQPSELVFL
jgi:hypothetical protein